MSFYYLFMNETQKIIKESLFQTITKLDESQKLEKEFKKDANLLIAQQKLSKIDSFTGYFEFMHNNFQTPVYFEGILYPSVTHAYHAARSLDDKTRRAILHAETFQVLGNIAIRIEDPKDWQTRKIKVMEQLLRDKFRRSEELQEKLRLTEGRALIMTYEEEKKNNLYWGIVKGKGQNQLGRILMKIRGDLIQDKLSSTNPVEIFNWINTSFKLVDEIQFVPEIKLTLVQGSKAKDHIILKGKSLYKIGQNSICDIILNHPSISKLHAVILVDQSLGVILIDLRSKNGTKLDGEFLKDNIPYRIKNGKKINFGSSLGEYIVDLDFSRVRIAYEKEQQKINNSLNLVSKLENNSNEVLIKTFGLGDSVNEDNDTVYVKNIPFNASESRLKEIFEENFGKVLSIYWPQDIESGFKNHYAFIKFESAQSAKEAVNYGLVSYKQNDKEDNYLGGNDRKCSVLKVSYSTNAPNFDKLSGKRNRYSDREDKKYNHKHYRRSRSRSRSKGRNKPNTKNSHRKKEHHSYQRDNSNSSYSPSSYSSSGFSSSEHNRRERNKSNNCSSSSSSFESISDSENEKK